MHVSPLTRRSFSSSFMGMNDGGKERLDILGLVPLTLELVCRKGVEYERRLGQRKRVDVLKLA